MKFIHAPSFTPFLELRVIQERGDSVKRVDHLLLVGPFAACPVLRDRLLQEGKIPMLSTSLMPPPGSGHPLDRPDFYDGWSGPIRGREELIHQRHESRSAPSHEPLIEHRGAVLVSILRDRAPLRGAIPVDTIA